MADELEEGILDVDVTDAVEGIPVSDAQIHITRLEDHTSEYDYEVNADDPSAIQSTVDGASSGESVGVTDSGSFEWAESIEVPDGVTLEISNDVSVTVPSSHNVTGYSIGSRTVYSLLTCANRSGAQDVTIRGGEYDMSNMTDDAAGYAGVWLHDASDSLIDDVSMTGAGDPIYGSSDYRGFGLALTTCTRSEIRDSEGYDSGYDDIAVRGGNQNCSVVRSGGSGASSGTIQTARWGNWDLTDYPTGTTYEDCWGRRIYCHDGIDTEWIGCTPNYRIQTIGTDNPIIRDSEGFEGVVLLYTYDSGSPTSTIENMDFSPNTSQDMAIQIGTNGPDHGDITVDGVTGERSQLIWFEAYSGGGAINEVEVANADFSGDGTDAIISQESGAAEAGTLHVHDSEFSGFGSGITGSYGEVIVENCTFNDLSESEAIDVTADNVEASGNTYA